MKLYIQGEHGKLLTFTPEEIKEKLGIPFDIAALSFAPRASGDESSHVVFCDMSFSNAFATTDVFVNPRKGIPFVQCSTENQLSDFRKADSHE